MRTALISLEPVYKCIQQAHGYPTSPPPLPARRSEIHARYRHTFQGLIKDVSGVRAVYLWFAKELDAVPEYVYVGQSQRSSIGLHRRFSNEFRQWYHILWMKAFSSDRYIKDAVEIYNTPTKDYTKDIRNQTLKRGATHIVYSTNLPESVNVDSLESELIFLFGCPRGNDDIPSRKPVRYSQYALSIRDNFLSCINKCSPYSLPLLT